MNNNKDFQASKWVEDIAMEYIKPYFENLYWDWFEDVRDIKEFQAEDIDFFINGSSVELKALTRVFNWVFLFELVRGKDWAGESKWAFLTSQAEYWLITSNEEKKGWLFKLKELRPLVVKILNNKEYENNIWFYKKTYEADREKAYKKIVLIKQDYILKNTDNQIINFI